MTTYVRFILLVIVSWVVMLTTHECGHILCGWCTGAVLQSYDLLPWHMPYSFFEPDPHPLITLWGGPILGVCIPVLVAFTLNRPSTWFVAYFCLLANGSYLALAWMVGDSFLDTTKLIQHGAWSVSLFAYCLVTILPGYFGFRNCCTRIFEKSKSQPPTST